MALASELALLFAKRPNVIKPGLDRMLAGLAALEARAWTERPAVVVAGTNGKGTTSAFLWQMLGRLGLTSGLYTSPHLCGFEERMVTTRAAPSEAEVLAELASMRATLPAALYEELSFFEVGTLLALRFFARARTDVDVLEIGLGGRWDAVNVVSGLVSVITSIGIDHRELLGDSERAIAAEKAGIMRAGRTTVTGEPRGSEAGQMLVLEAERRGSRLAAWGDEIQVDGETLVVTLPERRERRIAWGSTAPLARFLERNLALALATLVELGETNATTRTALVAYAQGRTEEGALAALAHGVRRGMWPQPPSLWGRFQRLVGPDARPLLFDVCHNPHGAVAFAEALAACGALAGGPLPAAVSILRDKDHAGILDVLRARLAPVVLFATSGERALRREDLASRHRDLAFASDFASALAQLPASAAGPTVVCGSVHAVGEVIEQLGATPQAALRDALARGWSDA